MSEGAAPTGHRIIWSNTNNIPDGWIIIGVLVDPKSLEKFYVNQRSFSWSDVPVIFLADEDKIVIEKR